MTRQSLGGVVGLVASALFAGGAEAQDAYRHFNFRVEFDGKPSAVQFSEVSGLGAEQEITEYRSGTDPDSTRKVPGRVKTRDVALKRDLVARSDLFAWLRFSRSKTRSIAVVLLDDNGKEVARFELGRCLPRSWRLPSIAAKTAPVEELTVACESLDQPGLAPPVPARPSQRPLDRIRLR